MDNALIDQQLINLLRIPLEQRTETDVLNTMQGLATAGSIDQVPTTRLQRELGRLFAITTFLASELGITRLHISCSITEHSNDPYLHCMLFPDQGDEALSGHGGTAEATLRDLHSVPLNDKTSGQA